MCQQVYELSACRISPDEPGCFSVHHHETKNQPKLCNAAMMSD